MLRYFESGLSRRAISVAVGTRYGLVANYLNRAKAAGISWPLSAELDERKLGRLLFPSQPSSSARQFIEPDFPKIHQELKQKGVTKLLPWNAQIFVAVLGASTYTFACASKSQNQADWINAHVNAFEWCNLRRSDFTEWVIYVV